MIVLTCSNCQGVIADAKHDKAAKLSAQHDVKEFAAHCGTCGAIYRVGITLLHEGSLQEARRDSWESYCTLCQPTQKFNSPEKLVEHFKESKHRSDVSPVTAGSPTNLY